MIKSRVELVRISRRSVRSWSCSRRPSDPVFQRQHIDLTPEAVLLRTPGPRSLRGVDVRRHGGPAPLLVCPRLEVPGTRQVEAAVQNWVAVVGAGLRCYNAPGPGFGELADFHPHEPEFLFCQFHLKRLINEV